MSKPLLLITGFLGAGKTTLLRKLVEELKALGVSADVILNDYENAEIDASTLPECTASIVPIAASCVCCDSLDDLVKLCLAAQESEGDVLLIEMNGTADPLPLLETFTLLESKLPFSPRWQVAVVDARHWGQRAEFAALERRQLETATHWITTHTEAFSETETKTLSVALSEVNPHAPQCNAVDLARDLAIVTNQKGVSRDANEQKAMAKSSVSVHDREHQLSHRFSGCQFPLKGRFRRRQMVGLLEALPGNVVRAKALVELVDTPGSRWLFERTGNHPVEAPFEVGGMTRAPASLICIGPWLDPQEIEKVVNAHLQTGSFKPASGSQPRS